MMQQAADIRDAVDPDEILFVVDAMIGQDAVTTAEAFRDGVGFTGVVLTKLDGDARGGAALSVREVTGQPILFASTGEKLDDFDVFHPDRMASRILGMGDVLTLIEQAEQAFDAEQAEDGGRQDRHGGELHPGGLPRADAGHPQDGPDRQPAGHAARRGPDEGRSWPQVDDSQLDRVAGDHPRHDPGRARRPEDHQRRPAGCASPTAPASTVAEVNQLVDRFFEAPQDDEADGRADGHAAAARAAAARRAARASKGKKGGRGPTPPKVRNPLGRGCRACPPASPTCRNMPKGLDELPPGLANIDLSKLKFPGQK